MPALMKAFPYITAHYRSGIYASNTAWTVLIRYRGNVFTGYFYSQNDQRESEVWPKSSQNFQLKLKKLWIRKLFIIWDSMEWKDHYDIKMGLKMKAWLKSIFYIQESLSVSTNMLLISSFNSTYCLSILRHIRDDPN